MLASLDARSDGSRGTLGPGKQLGQFRNGRVLEENLGRQIYFEEVPDSRDGFNRQQRMSAQVKKVVVNADSPVVKKNLTRVESVHPDFLKGTPDTIPGDLL